MLSRNFRLQKVGDLEWLQKNYNFSQIAFYIDELIILDVSRNKRDMGKFCDHVQALTEECFVPIAAGGGIRSLENAQKLLRSGADKIVINTLIFENPLIVDELVNEFGQQCVVGSIDVKKLDSEYQIWTSNGTVKLNESTQEWLYKIASMPLGEIYLNSIDRDGTGQGYLYDLLELLPPSIPIPVILAGGAGKYHHLFDGLNDKRVDAVATAHLFNFLGDGLKLSRAALYKDGIDLPLWNAEVAHHFKGFFSRGEK